jgi:hypothetical protein
LDVQLTWPSLNALHRIEGRVFGNTLVFRETAYRSAASTQVGRSHQAVDVLRRCARCPVPIEWEKLMRVHCVSVVLALSMTACAERHVDMPQDSLVKIQMLAEHKKVIPVLASYGDLKVTNVKLPDILVSNGGRDPYLITTVEIVGRDQDQAVVRYVVNQATLAKAMKADAEQLNKELAKPGHMQRRIGNVAYRGPFVAGTVLGSSEYGAILLSSLLFVEYTGPQQLTGLDIIVSGERAGKPSKGVLPVELLTYKTKGDYVFPLAKKDLLAANLSMNLTQHREMRSQEFAMDIAGIGKDRRGTLNVFGSDPSKLSNYFGYGRPIFAVGDGTVADSGTAFLDSMTGDPTKYSEEYFKNLMADLVPKIGITNAVCGNYIVIDHGNGEYSAYAHLKEGSISKKAGDKVNRGEVIAQLGNTGHSTSPHLHFQLMDGTDFFSSNGLPVAFSNLKAQEMSSNLAEANTLLFSDFLVLDDPPAKPN